MIDFVVVSSVLQLYVLDTQVKTGAELSTDHHLAVSSIGWRGRELDRPARAKQIVRICEERLASDSVKMVFNSHLWRSFNHIPEVVSVEVAAQSCGSNVAVANYGSWPLQVCLR